MSTKRAIIVHKTRKVFLVNFVSITDIYRNHMQFNYVSLNCKNN